MVKKRVYKKNNRPEITNGFKITLEYDGTNYFGWQRQTAKDRLPTIQGCLLAVLEMLFGKEIPLTASGRTDTGVHALGQVACFRVDTRMKLKNILIALNRYLPKDIRVKKIVRVGGDFHPVYSAKRKWYRYTIDNSRIDSVFHRLYTTWYPYTLNERLMQRAACLFKGRHDFSGLIRGPEKHKIRTIYKVTVKKNANLLQIDIVGNGFLYKMVRRIVAVLLDVGNGRLTLNQVKSILAGNKQNIGIQTARPQGLILYKIYY